MPLPELFSPGEPQASETVASGPAKIQANWQALADFLGIPVSPTQLTAPAFSLTSGGVITIVQAGGSLTADPTTPLGIASKQYVDNKAAGIPNGVASGTNTYAVTLTPAPANLSVLVGQPIAVQFTNANTTASTLNPNGLGAVSIASGSLNAGDYYLLIYDGSEFEIVGGDQSIIKKYKPTDQSVTSSTALINDNNLFFPIAASELWQFQIFANVQGGAGGLNVAFTVPSGASGGWVYLPSTQALVAYNVTQGIAGNVTAGFGYIFTGTVTNGGTPGTVQFQWAQNGSSATPTVVKTGSNLVATRLSP